MKVEVNVLFNNGNSRLYELYYYDKESYQKLLDEIFVGDSPLIKIVKYFDDTVKKNSVVGLKREEVISIDLDCSS